MLKMVKLVLEMKREDKSTQDPRGAEVEKEEDHTVEETDIPVADLIEEDLVVTVETEIETGKDTVEEDPDRLMTEKDILEESTQDRGQDQEKEGQEKLKKGTKE